MDEYDVVVVGGGIAGSVAAKYIARGGLKTLLVEKYKTPREKPCSGIQFPYFERIIGEEIPQNKLCKIQLNKVKMFLPNGKSYGSSFKMLNFMRKTFDHWLNQLAQRQGAEFIDECNLKDFEKREDHVLLRLHMKNRQTRQIKARYALDASGLRPTMRMKLRPGDFRKKSMGATLNYYVNGSCDLDPNTLYQFWNLEWNDAMFAWVYKKTLDDRKNYWVVGTGCNSGSIVGRQTLFYDYITREFSLQGEVVKKEGYSHSIDMSSKDRVWLGEERILMVGDAAGLVDQVRGVGMDSAALSGRLAAQALSAIDDNGDSVLREYARLTKSLVDQTRRNQSREINVLQSNDELQRYLSRRIVKTGLNLLHQSIRNKFRPLNKIVMLPP